MTAFRLSRLLFVLGFAWLAAGPLRAGDVKFPADGSGILLTLPEGWTATEETDGSLKCQSGDHDLTFVLFPNKVLQDNSRELPEIAQSLASGAGLEEITLQDGGEKPNPNGTKVKGIVVTGRKDDAAYAGVVSIITPAQGDACAFQCFGVKSSLLVNARAMKGIIDSFRAVK